jgi:hypothetical protein
MTAPRASRQKAEETGRRDGRPSGEKSVPLDPGDDVDGPADPVPEADDAGVQRGWEEAESMEGPAPTG